MSKRLVVVASLLLGSAALSQIRIVRDIHAGPHPNPRSEPVVGARIGPVYYFTTNWHRTFGRELWRTLGTAATTQLVKDIRPGTEGSAVAGLTAVGTTLYFVANDGASGTELWKSNGTAKGTVLVKDIAPGSGGSYPGELTAVGNTLFFAATTQAGRELWKSEGTAAGTVLVRDLNLQVAGARPTQLTALGNLLLFQATDAQHGSELFRSDGTAAGTYLVKDVVPGGQGSMPSDLTVLGSTLYFIAANASFGTDLWRTDGTTTGTTLVRAFKRTFRYPTWLNARILGTHAGALYLAADDGASGQELWRSDGTLAGTKLVKDIEIGSGSSFPSSIAATANGFVFGTNWLDAEPWVSDGTPAGTKRLKDIFPGRSSSRPTYFTSSGNLAYFAAIDPSAGFELWRTDGTPAGTWIPRDIAPGSGSSSPRALYPFTPDKVLFSANDGAHGDELWASDGTAAGTRLVKDVNEPLPGTDSSSPEEFVHTNGELLFRANDGVHGTEPWRSDGTAQGTYLLQDIHADQTLSSWATGFVAVGGTKFFAASDTGNGSNFQLWKTDGTRAGTKRLTNLRFTSWGLLPQHLVEFRGRLFFFADLGTGSALLSSDGTTAGTVIVKHFEQHVLQLSRRVPVVLGDKLIFAGVDAQHGDELWVSDGTTAGTRLLKDLNPGAASGIPLGLFGWNGHVWVPQARTASGGYALWKTDGTAQGTARLFSTKNWITGFEAVGDTLFFTTHAEGLWKTDGTSAGTSRVGTVGLWGDSHWMRNLGDRLLLFAGFESATGVELWVSDGTSAGTMLLKELMPGKSSGLHSRPFAAGSRRAFFVGESPQHGKELWQTDGTAAGTKLVQDLAPGTADALPGWGGPPFALVRGRLLFGAEVPLRGYELCALDVGASAQPVGRGCSVVPAPSVTATDPVLGTALQLRGEHAVVPSIGVVKIGIADAAPLWLDNGCRSYVSLTSFSLDLPFLVTRSEWRFPLAIPNDRALAGVHVGLQAWYLPTRSPNGFDMSNGLRLTLGM